MATIIYTALIICFAVWANYQPAQAQDRDICHPEVCSSVPVDPYTNKRNPQTATTKKLKRPTRRKTLCPGVDSTFRTADGTCNHPADFGQSNRPLNRLVVPAWYSDSNGSPRMFSTVNPGKELPSPRDVSRVVHPDRRVITNLTIMVMQWGQFMDHDLVFTPTPIVRDQFGQPVQCCNQAGPLHESCFPIRYRSGDPNFDGDCMELIRSAAAEDEFGNEIRPRENLNTATSFVDASTVYGSDEEKQLSLRDPERPHLLRATPDNFPPDNNLNDCIRRPGRNDICFLAGDERVNEHSALSLMHVVFLRFHNWAAQKISDLRPRLDKEDVFQIAKTLVTGVIQKIQYNDWLPIILGPNIRSQLTLNLDGNTEYDPKVDPRIFTEFSSAAFRMGHTLIPRSFPVSATRRVLLRELFSKPYEVRENLDAFAQGIVTALDPEDRSQRGDNFVVEEVTGHLFENRRGARHGFDLVSLNIQRARDHGIPPYNIVRAHLNLPRVKSFKDPILGINGDLLANVYDHVDDIDLYSGGLSEPPHDGGIIGETFSHLIGLQFQRLKVGDRYFFENKGNRLDIVKQAQISEIMKMTFSHVLCLTTGMTTVQRNVFLIPSPSNPSKSCIEVRKTGLSVEKFIKNLKLSEE